MNFDSKSEPKRTNSLLTVCIPGLMVCGLIALSGCTRSTPVAQLPDTGRARSEAPLASTEEGPVVAQIDTAGIPDQSAEKNDLIDSAAQLGSTESTVPESKEKGSAPAENAAGAASDNRERRDRAKGLGQFGGGGGGRGGMGGGLGGGGGGMGGGMGGMGGGMGGMGGGGMGGMGGGGVSIDPKIELKRDSSRELDQRKKEATTTRPGKGDFSSD